MGLLEKEKLMGTLQTTKENTTQSGETLTQIIQSSNTPELQYAQSQAERQIRVYEAAASAMPQGSPQQIKLQKEIDKAKMRLAMSVTTARAQYIQHGVMNRLREINKQNIEPTFVINGRTYTQSQLEKEGWIITKDGNKLTATPDPVKIGKNIEQDLLSLGWSQDSIDRVAHYTGFKYGGYGYAKETIAWKEMYNEYLKGKESGKWSTPEEFAKQYVNISLPFNITPSVEEVTNKIKKMEEEPPASSYYVGLFNWAQEQQQEPAGSFSESPGLYMFKEGMSFVQSPGGQAILQPAITFTTAGVMGGAVGMTSRIFPVAGRLLSGALTVGGLYTTAPYFQDVYSSVQKGEKGPSEALGDVATNLLINVPAGMAGYSLGYNTASTWIGGQMQTVGLKPISFGTKTMAKFDATINRLNPKNLLVRFRAKYIKPEVEFAPDVLSGKTRLSESPSVKESLRRFEKAKTSDYAIKTTTPENLYTTDTFGYRTTTSYKSSNYTGRSTMRFEMGDKFYSTIHSTPSKFPSSTKILKGTSESPGLYITPEGYGSPHFLKVSRLYPTKVELRLTPKSPSVLRFKLKSIYRAPRQFRYSKQSFNKWLTAQKPGAKGYITAKHELGAPEIEAVIRFDTPVKTYTTGYSFIQKLKGYKYYTKYEGLNIPIRDYSIIDTPAISTFKPQIKTTSYVSSKYSYSPSTKYITPLSPSVISSSVSSLRPSSKKSYASYITKKPSYSFSYNKSKSPMTSPISSSKLSSYTPSYKSSYTSTYKPSTSKTSYRYSPSTSYSPYKPSKQTYGYSPYVKKEEKKPKRKKSSRFKSYRQREFKFYKPKLIGEK